jgi:ABC-type nitrate/sulfonate/bicarbonate transport system substrate-binding protein
MLDLLKRGLVGGVVAVALSVGAQAGEIRLLSFGGATNLPIWMAQEKGFMEKEGVKLTFATTSGSVEQIRDFYAGKYDVISTAFDNIVAYAEGQSDIPLPGPFDMFAFMGGHGGMNTLMVRPEIKGYADIKGKTVAVDALKSGYGIVLYQILKDRGGLEYDRDYKAISVGNTDKRIEAMRGEKAVAAIIGSPQDMAVEREGYRWSGIGENLADRHLAPEPIVQGWLTDPMQCSNIMHPAFTEVGLARSTPEPGSSAGVVWSMVVARPRAQPR